jgi:hypothetical protein
MGCWAAPDATLVGRVARLSEAKAASHPGLASCLLSAIQRHKSSAGEDWSRCDLLLPPVCGPASHWEAASRLPRTLARSPRSREILHTHALSRPAAFTPFAALMAMKTARTPMTQPWT